VYSEAFPFRKELFHSKREGAFSRHRATARALQKVAIPGLSGNEDHLGFANWAISLEFLDSHVLPNIPKR
jgi:hypothetical protein